MRQIEFVKAEGSKNDFIIVADPEGNFPADLRRRFSILACDRRTGIGADGLVVLEDSAEFDFTMHFYNPDGSSGSMCGNGGRCAALHAFRSGVAATQMRFDVLDKSYRATVDGELVKLFFPQPGEVRTMQMNVDGREISVYFIHTGAPHTVILLDVLDTEISIDEISVQRIGKDVRWRKAFEPEGTNVNFISVDTSGTVHIRTFEKGVEDETLSCGTGTIASALVAESIHGIQFPVTFRSRGGDTLTVGRSDTEKGMKDGVTIFLEGRASLLYSGSVHFDSERDVLTVPSSGPS